MLQNFNRMVEGELLIVGVQQLEETFSIVYTYLRALGLVYRVWGSEILVSRGGDCIEIFVMGVY